MKISPWIKALQTKFNLNHQLIGLKKANRKVLTRSQQANSRSKWQVLLKDNLKTYKTRHSVGNNLKTSVRLVKSICLSKSGRLSIMESLLQPHLPRSLPREASHRYRSISALTSSCKMTPSKRWPSKRHMASLWCKEALRRADRAIAPLSISSKRREWHFNAASLNSQGAPSRSEVLVLWSHTIDLQGLPQSKTRSMQEWIGNPCLLAKTRYALK